MMFKFKPRPINPCNVTMFSELTGPDSRHAIGEWGIQKKSWLKTFRCLFSAPLQNPAWNASLKVQIAIFLKTKHSVLLYYASEMGAQLRNF